MAVWTCQAVGSSLGAGRPHLDIQVRNGTKDARNRPRSASGRHLVHAIQASRDRCYSWPGTPVFSKGRSWRSLVGFARDRFCTSTLTFQDMVMRLGDYWARRGCIVHVPFDCEVGADTVCLETFRRVLGPEPYRAAYLQPSDGRPTVVKARIRIGCTSTWSRPRSTTLRISCRMILGSTVRVT